MPVLSRSLARRLSVALAAVGLVVVTLAAQPSPRDDEQRAWNLPFEPFKIVDNIYYVGTAELTSYLITSDDGHVLIDTGLEEDAAQVAAGIQQLGFALTDVKLLLNTQAHYDHAAGLAAIKEKTGARFLASVEDAKVLAAGGRDDFAFGDRYLFPPVAADETIKDGQVVTLGPIALTARLTPGHTKGTTTWVTTAQDDGRSLLVVFPGSATVNPGVIVHGNPKYPGMVADFDRTFSLLKTLKPDIYLPQHARQFDLAAKRDRQKAGATPNPFIDPDGYARVVRDMEKAYRSRP